MPSESDRQNNFLGQSPGCVIVQETLAGLSHSWLLAKNAIEFTSAPVARASAPPAHPLQSKPEGLPSLSAPFSATYMSM